MIFLKVHKNHSHTSDFKPWSQKKKKIITLKKQTAQVKCFCWGMPFLAPKETLHETSIFKTENKQNSESFLG